jgi:2'-5' RNA ligase
LFVGIDLPSDVDEQLTWMAGGIHGAHWQAADKLHLTVRYIGTVDGGQRRAVEAALEDIDVPAFSLRLRGVGFFPPRGQPRSVWAGVEDDTALHDLHDRIDHRLTKLGLPHDGRKFAAHVTLARLGSSPPAEVAEFLGRHALLLSRPFLVDAFALYSSVRGPNGSKYAIESLYPLATDGPSPSDGV